MFSSSFFLLSLSTAQDDCTPKTCSDHGPPIHFPFRLKDHHPPQCGYRGFDLSCSPNNATVLNLPNSVKVLVTHIDYKSRLIHIKDPNCCFPQQLQNLHLSTTPFQFAATVYSFSLFSCPSTKSDFSYRVPCLDGDGREVYAEYGEGRIHYYYDMPPMLSCRKMYNLSVPIEAFDQADLQLKWHQRVEGHGLEIACVTLGSFLLLVIFIAMYWFYRQKKIKRKCDTPLSGGRRYCRKQAPSGREGGKSWFIGKDPSYLYKAF